MKMSEKIKKPWAVYGWFLGSWSLGRVITESKNSKGEMSSLDIRYWDDQRYPAECWDPEWVKTFDNPLEAIDYFVDHQMVTEGGGYSRKEAIELFREKFPKEREYLEKLLLSESTVRQEKLQKMHDILDSYAKRNSPSSDVPLHELVSDLKVLGKSEDSEIQQGCSFRHGYAPILRESAPSQPKLTKKGEKLTAIKEFYGTY